jgi:hypothetical protein
MGEMEIEVVIGLLKAMLWPAASAVGVLVFTRLVLPTRWMVWAIPVAFVTAYCLGHALAAGSDLTFRPVRNWQWMLYLVPISGAVGLISTSIRATWTNRCLLVAVFLAVTAGLLTSRPTLWAPRAMAVALLFAYFALLWTAIAPLERRVSWTLLAATYALAAAAVGVVISEQISFSDGKTVMAAAAGLAAISVVTWFASRSEPAPGLTIPFAIAVGGWAWVEALAEARLWPILLVAFAPVGVWVTQLHRLRNLHGAACLAIQIAVTVGLFGVASSLLRTVAGE